MSSNYSRKEGPISDAPPNILYIHSHDSGRYVQPYGSQVPTPNIQLLADQGVLFREAFCAAPTCSGSRASLLTGLHCHNNGMLGLAHRGWQLNDYGQHWVHALRRGGYRSTMIGEQHISVDPGVIGYDEVIPVGSSRADDVAPLTIETLGKMPSTEPWFLSVGFFETHRSFFAPTSVRDTLYSQPPSNLPDVVATRRDMAAFKASARALDQGVGAVLHALHDLDLVDDTLVLCTTDHGIAFPNAKATLFDRGIGVLMIMRGPGFTGGKIVDAPVSHLDVYPTLCELAGVEAPEWLQGDSLMPLVEGEVDRLHEAIFAETTYHAAYQPHRAARTERLKYIRRFDDYEHPVLANCDDSESKDLLVAAGWGDQVIPEEQLYD
jgi:N-sulfoglucosamine sulfohydrolase